MSNNNEELEEEDDPNSEAQDELDLFNINLSGLNSINNSLSLLNENLNLSNLINRNRNRTGAEQNQINSNIISNNISTKDNFNLKFFPILNAEQETFQIFKSIEKSEKFKMIIQLNIFSNFLPTWNFNKIKNSINNENNLNISNDIVIDNEINSNLDDFNIYNKRENIYNTCAKLSRVFKKMKNHGKIKNSNKRKKLISL